MATTVVDSAVKRRIVSQGSHGTTVISEDYDLYVSQASADDGVWMDTAGWETITVWVDIGTTGTVKIGGSSAATIPANSADGTDIKTNLTADGFFTIQKHEIPRWVKVHAHATSDTITCGMRVTRLAYYQTDV